MPVPTQRNAAASASQNLASGGAAASRDSLRQHRHHRPLTGTADTRFRLFRKCAWLARTGNSATASAELGEVSSRATVANWHDKTAMTSAARTTLRQSLTSYFLMRSLRARMSASWRSLFQMVSRPCVMPAHQRPTSIQCVAALCRDFAISRLDFWLI